MITVGDAKTKKMELEIALNKLLTQFEKDTECTVMGIDITAVTSEQGDAYIAIVKTKVEL